MNAAHTPGLLTWAHMGIHGQHGSFELDTHEGFHIAETIGGLGSEEQANARRLAACWNACDGVETELLEQYPAPFSALRAQRDHFEAVAKANGRGIINTACEIADLKAQRDALLAIARSAASIGFHTIPKDAVCMCTQCELVRDARAAITKATGAQS